MFCEQCGKQIAEGNKFCDQCGWKVPEAEVAAETTENKEVVETPVEETAPVAEAPATEAPVAEAPAAEAPVAETPVETPVAPAAPVEAPKAEKAKKEKKAKKGAGKAVVLFVVAILVVIGALVAFNYKALANFVHKTFDSPEKYYSYVMSQQVEDAVDLYMLYYDEYIVNGLFGINDKSVDANVTVEMSEDLRDLLGMSGVDFEWLEKANFGFNMNMKEQDMSFALKGGVNGADIASLNVLMDFADEMIYMQVPELNKTYFGADISDAGIEFDEDMWEQYDALKEYIPESKELRELLVKYAMIALESIEDIEKSTEKVEVGDVTQKCTALEVTLDSDAFQAIAEAVLKELAKDKDFEKLFFKVAGMAEEFDYPVDADDLYDQFVEGIEEALDNIEDLDMGDVEIVMVIYVDNEGNVIGTEMEAEGMNVSYLMPQKGSNFEMEYVVEVEDYDETISISVEGAGKKKGGKISGEFEVKYGTYALADIVVENYDTEKAKKGEVVGSFTISPSKSLSKLMDVNGSSSDAAIVSAILDYSLQIDMNTNLQGGNVTITVLDGKDVFAKVAFDITSGKGSKVSAPSKDVLDPNDDDDLEEWVEGVDWDKLIKTLEKANVPDKYIEMLEEAVEELE